MTAGARLRERRRELGISVAQLAKSAGLRPSTLYDLERGDNRTSKQLHRLCQTLGLNINWVETGLGERLAREIARESALEITLGGERITAESARLAAQIERLDDITRGHVKAMVDKLAQAQQAGKNDQE
jgi:transcriptional regulator with XRE-family HTH domain